MTTRTVLLTGFEPFESEPVNPSWEAVRALDGERVGDAVIVARQLPCVFGKAIEALAALVESLRPDVVIAVGQVNDVRLYRELLTSGIHDYLLKPLVASHVRETLQHAQAVFAAPRNQDPSAAHAHVSTAVIGTRGGVGASTIATAMAWLFASDHQLPTALFDLDIHFGTGALALDLEPGRGLTDAIENPSRIDGLFLERAMIKAADNLSILSAEAPISAPLMTDGSAFIQLEEEFRQSFEMTVVDLPRSMLVNFPHVLADVNVIVLVTELTLAGARDCIRILSWLRANAGHALVLVVANKVYSGLSEIGRADFEASIERKINYVVPFDAKAAIHAAKLGQTFTEANKASKATAVLRELAQAVRANASDSTAPVEVPEAKSLLGLIDFKSLLARKDKAAGR